MKLEKVKIIDAANKRRLEIFVTPEVAKKCRSDNSYLLSLLKDMNKFNPDGKFKNLDGIRADFSGSVMDNSEENNASRRSGLRVVEEDSDPNETRALTRTVWTQNETLKLIELYAQLKSQNISLSKMWSDISNKLAEEGFQKTKEQCDYKWGSLMKSYKRHTRGNAQGLNKAVFPYFNEMHAVLTGKGYPQSSHSLTPKKPNITEENIWSYDQVKELIDAFVETEFEINEENKPSDNFWGNVSDKLKAKGMIKSKKTCKSTWKKLVSQYILYKKGDPDHADFGFDSEFENIFGDRLPPEDYCHETDIEEDQEEETAVDDSVEYIHFESIASPGNEMDDDDPDEPQDMAEEEEAVEQITIQPCEPTDEEEVQWSREKWSHDAILKLIHTYEFVRNQKSDLSKNKKYMWANIAKHLEQRGVTKSVDQCRDKWKNLLKTYRNRLETGDHRGINDMYFNELSRLYSSESDNQNEIDPLDTKKEEINGEITLNQNWSTSETTALIEAYKETKNRLKTKTGEYFWRCVWVKLQEKGVRKDPKSIQQRFRNLLKSYKLNKSSKNYKSLNGVFSQLEKAMSPEPIEKTISPIKKETKVEQTDHIWMHTEVKALLKHIQRFNVKNKGQIPSYTSGYWKAISKELMERGVRKDPDACRKKFEELKTNYRSYMNKTSPTCECLDDLEKIFQTDPVLASNTPIMSDAKVTEIANSIKKITSNPALHLTDSTEFEVTNVDQMKEVTENAAMDVSSLSNIKDITQNVNQQKQCSCRSHSRSIAKQRRHEEKMQLLRKKIELEERKVLSFERYVNYLMQNNLNNSQFC